ncbi:MAG: 3-deoxy-D-manno-octulosonic acid transferase [Deltaproteobacteria bacterium]|nr:3-deoxy-D-manno-octulosonic acid transferase [Deltaproteobacteria bacterium]
MIYRLYDILLHISVIALLPYFVFKMITARKYREGIPERFGFYKAAKLKALSGGPVVWIHAVSVGETKAAAPVVKLFKERNPDTRVVFSTVTRTGNNTAAKDLTGLIDALIYFPLDLSWVVNKAIRLFNPKAFIVIEKEIWPNIFRQMNKKGVPVIVLNGTISDRSSRRFARYGFFFKGVFGGVSLFSARTKEDREKAVCAGVKDSNAVATGNIKFDLSPPDGRQSSLTPLGASLGINPKEAVIVAGSTHPGEEEMILNAFKGLRGEFKNTRLILAPRHPERFAEVEALLRRSGLPYSKRSKGNGGEGIVLLDTVGELMMVYSFATVAFVGGSLVKGIGGHNLLEPAYYGKPVIYGPHLTAYLNMAELLEGAGGGFRAEGVDGLKGTLEKLLSDAALCKEAGESAWKVVEANRGAARKSVEAIEVFLNKAKSKNAVI